MPLARILTRYPEQAGALSDELRQHGYTVEFASPELTGKPPADLEIDFEICSEPDALSRASELADNLHTDVAVSPGVLMMPKPVAEEPAENPAEQVTAGSFARNNDMTVQGPPIAAMEDTPPVQQEPFTENDSVAAPMAAMENVVAEEPLIAGAEQFSPVEQWEQGEELRRDAEADAPQITLPVDMLAEEAHSVTPPARTAFDDEMEIARAASPSQAEPAKENDFLADAGEKSAAAIHGAAIASKELLSAARERTQDAWASVRQRSAEYREQMRVYRAEREAERQYKLLQLEKRREMAEQRAVELEAARQAAAERLHQLLRERGALTESQPAPPQKVETAPVVSMPVARTTPAWRRLLAYRIRVPFARTYRPEVEAILMGVAAACAFVVLGLAVASFHARPAISSSFKQPATSSKGVTVQGGGVTVKAGTPAVPAAQPVAPATAAVQPQAAPKPAAAVRQQSESDVTVRHFPAAAAKPNPGRGSSKHLADDDVVIRHFGAQPKPTAQAAPETGLKHYSDLDN